MQSHHNVAFNYFGESLDKSNPRLNAPGTYSMLNSTYFWGNLYEMPGRGPSVLAETITVNLGISNIGPVQQSLDSTADLLKILVDPAFECGAFDASPHLKHVVLEREGARGVLPIR